MAMNPPLHTLSHPPPPVRQAAETPHAMARVLTVALAYGVAAVPAFVAGRFATGACLALLAMALVVRFPMAGWLAAFGGGLYALLTGVGLAWPQLLGPPGILAETDPFMRACAWLTLLAGGLGVALLDPSTFQAAFRREGRPVARWISFQR